MTDEKIFADGFVFKRNENAPDFVVGRVSIKVEDAVAFLKANQKNGWVNLDVKTARSGNFYMELDTFEPTKKAESTQNAKPMSKKVQTAQEALAEEADDLPF